MTCLRRAVTAILECGHEYTLARTSPEVHCCACGNKEATPTDEERWQRETEELLRATLAFAVPLWIRRFIDERRSLSAVLKEAQRSGEIISEQGDSLLRRSKAIPGDRSRVGTAEVFNALAAGLAAASFQSGGVKAFGNHFESKPEWLEGKP